MSDSHEVPQVSPSYAELGDALMCAREAVRIAEETGSAFSRVVTYSGLGGFHAAFGNWEEAERVTSGVPGPRPTAGGGDRC
jgi:hypothetical protein